MKMLRKKIQASSLIETLVATVIIIIVFGIASLTLNNLVQNSAKQQRLGIDNELNRLEYLFQHQKIDQKYQGAFENWTIHIEESPTNSANFILQAEHKVIETSTVADSNQKITKTINYVAH